MKKLCIDCRHYRAGSCWHPMNTPPSMVDGQNKPRNSTEYLREDHRMGYETCGNRGVWFERAEVQAAA